MLAFGNEESDRKDPVDKAGDEVAKPSPVARRFNRREKKELAKMKRKKNKGTGERERKRERARRVPDCLEMHATSGVGLKIRGVSDASMA